MLAAYGIIFVAVGLLAESIQSRPLFLLRAWWARSILFVAGYTDVPISTDGRKVTKPTGGDVVVANRSSPIDVLLLLWVYPTALFTTSDRAGLVAERSTLGAIADAFLLENRPGRAGTTLAVLRKRHRNRVIVVFPEGTASNNRGVLAFGQVAIGEAFVTAIKYNNPPTVTTAVPGSYGAFVWALTSVPLHGCRIRGSAHRVTADHADLLAKYARIPKTSLGVQEKASFVEAWRRR